MKNNILFWNEWPKPYKYTAWTGVTLALSALIGYILIYSLGINVTTRWELLTELDMIKSLGDHIKALFITVPLDTDRFLLFKRWDVTFQLPPVWMAYTLHAIVALGIVVFLTYITRLERFWFLAGMIILTMMLIAYKFENILLWGSYSKYGLFLSMVLYFGAAYYFHAFKTTLTAPIRFIIFLGITAILLTIIHLFSEVPEPFLYLATYGMVIPVVLTIVFILMIGHEVLWLFLNIITSKNSPSSSNSFLHFILISLVYLANVTLIYLYNSAMISVRLIFIETGVLLVISSLIGLYGFKSREITYHSIFPFRMHGIVLYCLLMVVCFSTVGYFEATGNDTMLEAFEDAVAMSQLGYGLIFIIYVFSNFLGPMRENMQVAKIVYKPTRMPYFTFRFAGIIAVAALFFSNRMISMQQAMAGYHIGLGDMFYRQKELLLAEEYYKEAQAYNQRSRRVNTMLAQVGAEKNKQNDKLFFLSKALDKHPTEELFVALANSYLAHNKYFDAIFTLGHGMRQFPKSNYISNNLGLLYARTDVIDSTLLYLMSPMDRNSNDHVSATNTLAMLAKYGLYMNKDTVQQISANWQDIAVNNNLMVISEQAGYGFEQEIKERTVTKNADPLDLLCYEHNSIISGLKLLDTGFVSTNQPLFDDIRHSWLQGYYLAASSVSLIKNGQNNAAFNNLYSITSRSTVQNAQFNLLTARLALSKEEGQLAEEFYLKAVNQRPDIRPELIMAQTLAGNKDSVAINMKKILLDSIKMDDAMKSVMAHIDTALQVQEHEAIFALPDMPKYMYILLNRPYLDEETIEALSLSFMADDFKVLSALILVNRYFDAGETDKASAVLDRINSVGVSGETVDKILTSNVRLWHQKRDLEALGDFLRGNKNFSNKTWYEFAQAAYYHVNGQLDKADTAFTTLASKDAFYTAGVMAAASFMKNEKGDDQRAYDLLLQAIRINMYDANINEAYIMACLDLGLKDYARDALNDYFWVADEFRYDEFERRYRIRLQEMEDVW